MDGRVVGLGEFLGKGLLIFTPSVITALRLSSCKEKQWEQQCAPPNLGPAAAPHHTPRSRPPDPLELPVTKSLVRARGPHREHRNWKHTVTTGKKQQGSKWSDLVLPKHHGEGRSPLTAVLSPPLNTAFLTQRLNTASRKPSLSELTPDFQSSLHKPEFHDFLLSSRWVFAY